MTVKFKIILLLISMLVLTDTFGQNLTKKELSNKWQLNLLVDSIKTGDTVVFTKDKKYNDFNLRPNQELQRHTFYGKCGNKFFLDNFFPKPKDWENIGCWSLSTADNKTFLDFTFGCTSSANGKDFILNEGSKSFTFLFIARNKKQISFIVQNVTTIRGFR